MSIPYNPFAFPCEEWANKSDDPFATPKMVRHHGMTLRDYFAGQALAGATATLSGFDIEDEEQFKQEAMLVAKFMYQIADAMIKARENGAK